MSRKAPSAAGGVGKKPKLINKGTDSKGNTYNSVEELWKREFEDEPQSSTSGEAGSGSGTGTGSSKKLSWYQKGADYWMSQDASVDGVLGGFGHISPVDISGSRAFLQSLPSCGFDRAIDCGAGIGRISRDLLCPMFKEVDLVEQNPLYVDKARSYCGGQKTMRHYFTRGLQDFVFAPASYDVIWIQWVIGHLPDADFLPFMDRCVKGLRQPGGYIVLKENNAKKGFVMDLEDQSVTRQDAQFRLLFEQAGLELVATELQKNFPSVLFPVRMYALRPKPETLERLQAQPAQETTLPDGAEPASSNATAATASSDTA